MPLTSTSLIISHWYKLFENLQTSPSDIYQAVEEAIQTRKIPDSISSRVDWTEGGAFSARREYLRLTRGRHVIDICGAPFGTGFFVSWWLAETRPSPVGPSLGAMGVFLFMIYVLGIFYTIIALLLIFAAVGAFISVSPEEDWVSYALVVPVFGPLWERLFAPATYYRIDTALMFQNTVHASVLEVLDGITEAKGIRALSEADRKPILKDFFQR
ncbi:MAG: hypothetical protein ACREX3_18735 [Gammaproteobacteria bacterium]